MGAAPLVAWVMRRTGLREILAEHVPATGREAVAPADALTLIVLNLTLARDPLYELGAWADGLDPRAAGLPAPPPGGYSDDRLARALDRLHEADRATLMTRAAVAAVRAFGVRTDRIHNDSTSVKAFGRIPGRARGGLELRRGHSKDHRPDLRQLVYCLSISGDGAVPVHHRVYPGNRNDDTTHIETWDALRALRGSPDFLYVGDCKLCTEPQLGHIRAGGGTAVTSPPENLLEVKAFRRELRASVPDSREVWRRPAPGGGGATEYFRRFAGVRRTRAGDALHWFRSSRKRLRDRDDRERRLRQAEDDLAELAPKLNRGRLRRRPDILRAVRAALARRRAEGLLAVRVRHHVETWRVRRRGRPGPSPAPYRIRRRTTYGLEVSRDAEALKAEARLDGVFPLLCTDPDLPPGAVLRAYKSQPALEKRFCQFKTIHRAAPLLFKRVSRVEANMGAFFLALMMQALLERELRRRLARPGAPPLRLYPEDREAPHPTASRLFKTFAGVSTYTLIQDGRPVEEHRDELSPTQRQALDMLGIPEETFWGHA